MVQSIMNLTRDVAGNNTFGLPFSKFKWDNTLTVGGGAKALTIPAKSAKWSAIFAIEPGAEVWVANNETATLPAIGEFVTTDSEMNPVSREVKAGDVLSLITGNADAKVGIVLYPIQ